MTWARRHLDPICNGAIHVIPVPTGMTVPEAWDAISDGTLPDDPDCCWGIYECPGGVDCPCLDHELADTYQHRQDGALVYDHASTLLAPVDEP